LSGLVCGAKFDLVEIDGCLGLCLRGDDVGEGLQRDFCLRRNDEEGSLWRLMDVYVHPSL
jgi:hypothetical protein